MGIAGRGVFILLSSFLEARHETTGQFQMNLKTYHSFCLQGFSPGSYLRSRHKIELIIYHNNIITRSSSMYCMFRKPLLTFFPEINFIINIQCFQNNIKEVFHYLKSLFPPGFFQHFLK